MYLDLSGCPPALDIEEYVSRILPLLLKAAYIMLDYLYITRRYINSLYREKDDKLPRNGHMITTCEMYRRNLLTDMLGFSLFLLITMRWVFYEHIVFFVVQPQIVKNTVVD